MKASDLFVRCLENEGCEFIFGVPGEENADVMISLLDSKVRFIVCRHEQAAAFMAEHERSCRNSNEDELARLTAETERLLALYPIPTLDKPA